MSLRVGKWLRAGLATAAIAIGLTLPGAALGSNIVYEGADGNVWLASPDGSTKHQVTLDGTSADPYESPSQADDGTIIASRGSGSSARLHRVDQAGKPLNDPIATPAPGTGPLDPRLSPDGRYVAYWFLTTVGDPWCPYCIGIYGRTFLSHPDRLTGHEEIPGPYCCENPSWRGNEGLFLTTGSATAWHWRMGSEAQEWWADSDHSQFDDPEDGNPVFASFNDGEVSRDGARIALVRGDDQETIQLYKANGPPPALPSPGCAFLQPVGGKFASPTFSPDGQSLAWQEGDGIWVATIGDVLNCATISSKLVIPGGKLPNWGPAAINPPSRGDGGGGGTEPPAGGSSSEDCETAKAKLRKAKKKAKAAQKKLKKLKKAKAGAKKVKKAKAKLKKAKAKVKKAKRRKRAACG